MSGILSGEKNSPSSMRLNLILAAVGAFIIMLAVAAYIIISVFKGNHIDWTTMGVFAAGIATVITGVSYTKVLQKKVELDNEKQ